MYTVAQASRTPLPTFSEDDVLDYMVKEAIVFRARDQEKQVAEEAKRNEWKQRPVGSGSHG